MILAFPGYTHLHLDGLDALLISQCIIAYQCSNSNLITVIKNKIVITHTQPNQGQQWSKPMTNIRNHPTGKVVNNRTCIPRAIKEENIAINHDTCKG